MIPTELVTTPQNSECYLSADNLYHYKVKIFSVFLT